MHIILKQIYYKIKPNPSQISLKTNFSTKSAQNKSLPAALCASRRRQKPSQDSGPRAAHPTPHTGDIIHTDSFVRLPRFQVILNMIHIRVYIRHTHYGREMILSIVKWIQLNPNHTFIFLLRDDHDIKKRIKGQNLDINSTRKNHTREDLFLITGV
jgi:hypothetical protein